MPCRESYYEFYDIYTNNTSYYIHENIYICIYHIYNIYINFKNYGTVFSFFFFLQINVYSVSASKYKQIFFPLPLATAEAYQSRSYRYLAIVQSTRVSKTFKRSLFNYTGTLTSTICCCTSRRYQTTDECNNLIGIKSPNLP